MSLFRKAHRKHAISQPHRKAAGNGQSRLRLCRFEQMEPRQLLSVSVAPIHVGTVYFEDSHPHDEVGDVFEITFNGGAPGTQLTELRIDTDKLGDGLGMGDAFFDTASGGLGVYGSTPFAIVNKDGIDSVTCEVADGGTQLVLRFSGFNAGEKLVFSIDVDEQGFLQPNAVAEGAEFEGSKLTATFAAPHYMQAVGSDIFRDAYDGKLAESGLNLPLDAYDPPSIYMPPGSEPGPVYTAAAIFPLEQTPLPITLSGTVFEDFNLDVKQQTGEPGIGGVSLTLYELLDGGYVSTGRTTLTNADGSYKFDGLLPSTYRVVETQPSGYLSVGAAAGKVDNVVRGSVTSVDILSSINLDGGDDSVHNDFAETRPAELTGHVYHDRNNDGFMDPGEEGIGGVLLTLLDGDGNPTGLTTTTDASGFYRFEDLMPGVYGVAEAQPAAYLDGLDAPGTAGGFAYNPGDLIDGVYLVGGQLGADYDFGELLPVSISGYVYVDANNNAWFDESETPIGGARLELLDADGNPTGLTATTDASGYYIFDDLVPGTYGVVEVQPAGYFDGLDTPGTAGGFAHNPGDLIDGVDLISGQSGIDYDFGELLPVSISGYVYVDANNNARFDEDEAPISGAELELLDADGVPTGLTATTDASGYYLFDDLAPGTYGVAEVQPAGYFDGLDAAGSAGGLAYNPGDLIDTISLENGVSAKHYDFGELLPASIRGQVFADLNNNGVADPGDPLLAGVTIYLLDADGDRIDSTTTDASGKYAFTDLLPGVYGVEEVQPTAYLQGNDQVGSAGGIQDGPDRLLGAALDSGVNGIHYDFWEVVPAKISGYVFQDGPAIVIQQGDPQPNILSLRDGKLTSDDKRLSGVVLELCDGTGVPLLDAYGNPITTVTDANGYYEFNRLYSGMYSVVEVQPSPYLPGIDTAGSNGGMVINTYAALDPTILSIYAVDPKGSAIVQIWVEPGDAAAEYNFSEVLVETEPPDNPPFFPPSPPSPPIAPPVAPYAGYQPGGHAYLPSPLIVMRPMLGGSGGPGGYSWHLSVIDAGQPRRDGSGDQFTQYPQNSIFDPVSWTGAALDQSQWILADENGVPQETLHFGMPGALPVVGDWDGSGTTKIGVFLDGLWFLDFNGDGRWDEEDLWIKLGKKDDQAVTGDWDGDGKTDIGIFGPAWIGDLKAEAADPGLPDAQNQLVRSRPKNVPPDAADAAVGWRTMKKGAGGKMRSDVIDHVFQYGTKGDVAVTGDWNGDGIHAIGIFRHGVWFLDLDGDGRWSEGDVTVDFGQEGDLPVVGDWTGDGISKLGVYRNGTFYLDANNNRQIDATDKVFQLGQPGDKPVAGDWNGDGVDTVGVYSGTAPTEAPLQASRQ